MKDTDLEWCQGCLQKFPLGEGFVREREQFYHTLCYWMTEELPYEILRARAVVAPRIFVR